jgi:hypothetical protein
MRLPQVFCTHRNTSTIIFRSGNWFEMSRVYASPNSKQMVKR